jgi:nucleoside phosphorylase
MPHKSVAVVVAMARELAPMLHGMRSERVDGIDFFESTDIAVAVGGIGRKAASRAAEALIRRYSPGVLISAGLVGALTPKLKVGDVVEVKEVVDADSSEIFETGRAGAVLLTESGVAGPADKPIDAQRFSADIVDMEASAEAEVAKQYGVEFMALKAVSDEVNFAMPPLGKFVSDRGKFETLRFLAWVSIRPKWWSVVRQLNDNSNLAAANLSKALDHLIKQRVRIASEKGIQPV